MDMRLIQDCEKASWKQSMQWMLVLIFSEGRTNIHRAIFLNVIASVGMSVTNTFPLENILQKARIIS